MWLDWTRPRREPGEGRVEFAQVLAIAGIAASLIGSYGFGKIARPTPYNPVLMGPPSGPCNPSLGDPNVVAGTDVYGRPVAPADVNNGPGLLGDIAVDGIYVREKHGTYVHVTGLPAPPECIPRR